MIEKVFGFVAKLLEYVYKVMWLASALIFTGLSMASAIQGEVIAFLFTGLLAYLCFKVIM